MSMFTEDPTLPTAVLLMAAACCLAALRVRQEGKYLIRGGVALLLAAAVVAFEWFWVTDKERIEAVVYDLRDALLASDASGILAHLTPNAQFVQSGSSMTPEATRTLIIANVAAAKIELARIRGLQTDAGRLTRRGKAEFKVFTQGSIQAPMGLGGLAGTADTSWSLGFEETEPGVWKVNRITPVSTPISPSFFASAATSGRADALRAPGMAHFPRGPRTDDGEWRRSPSDTRMTRKALARERQRQFERAQ